MQRVAQPWQPGDFQNGFQLYWHVGTLTDAELDPRIEEILDYVVAHGANSLGLTFPIYTDGAYPTKVYNGPETPSVDVLRRVIEAAKERGLRVMVRPLIDEANIMTTTGKWRGNIEPPNVAAWFASYRAVLAPYVELAATTNSEEFVVGTELFSLQGYGGEWQRIRDEAKAVFGGRLSYGLNWDGFSTLPPFRQLGLDLYPSIDLNDGASTDQLTAAMTAWLQQQPAEVRARLTLQEVGIPALSGVYRQPWLWGSGNDNLNFQTQARWFAAACQAARSAGTQGIYYWMIDSNVDPSEVDPATSPAGSFMKRPAEDSIQRCFEQR